MVWQAFDNLVKSYRSSPDGLWKKLDILDVVSETAIWQYMWYGKSPFQIYNDVDRAFYESINLLTIPIICRRTAKKPATRETELF